MNDIDRYIHAATRDNTRRSYRSAVDHFELEWGGFLPATADSVAKYLAAYAGQLANSTLRQRMSAIAQWHIDQGFPDPTKSPLVKKVLKGIQAVHPERPQQAKPIALHHVETIDAYLQEKIAEARAAQNSHLLQQAMRDRAIVLLGFWRGFRSDELSRIEIQHVSIVRDEGISLYLPYTKTESAGVTYKTPALRRLCPVDACHEWLMESGLIEGPLFPSINRWGHLGKKCMHASSFIGVLRKILNDAHIADSGAFSSHSLRRGFANWASSSGWDLKTIMEYVGWKDLRTAMRYIDSGNPFERHALATDRRIAD